MKKEIFYKIVYVIAFVLLIGFITLLIIDVCNYNPNSTSAPFYVCVLIRTLEFLLPSTIFFILGLVFKNKLRNKFNDENIKKQ